MSVLESRVDPRSEELRANREAMKMEHTIRAFAPGRVENVSDRTGDQVSEGTVLLAIAAED